MTRTSGEHSFCTCVRRPIWTCASRASRCFDETKPSSSGLQHHRTGRSWAWLTVRMVIVFLTRTSLVPCVLREEKRAAAVIPAASADRRATLRRSLRLAVKRNVSVTPVQRIRLEFQPAERLVNSSLAASRRAPVITGTVYHSSGKPQRLNDLVS